MDSRLRSKPRVRSRHRSPDLGGRADAPASSREPEVRRAAARGAAAALTLALAFAIAQGLVAAASAWASDPFPVEETFRGATFGEQWRHGGSAELTGTKEAEGWLRLTSANGGEFGYAYDNEAFPSADGALVEFEYADWGGSGADGLTFFLFDGSTSETEFHAGEPGGALGYAPCYSEANGLSSAYVGVGFDEYGNFTNLGSICGLDGTEFLPNHVSIRGSAAERYKLLTTAPTSESLRAERSQARRVTIAVTSTGKLSVYIRYPDGTYQKVTEGFQLPAAPETLKFGYVASTGAFTDNHEIRDAQVIKPTELTPSVAQTAGGHERGKPLTWTAVVHNDGPNPTQREQLRATTGEQSLSSVSWTCEASGSAVCTSASGTGLPSLEAGAMPEGSSFTYKITGTPTPTTDYAQMTFESEPRGDTGELNPEKERATATTNLTPLFDKDPSFTLAANGEASATAVAALGGEMSYTYAWQRCEANGASCSNIAGAESTAYHTTGADMDHTLRFTETATNSAGSAMVDSVVYGPLPTAEITSAPARYVATREAGLSFTTSTKEAVLECSLDGAAWSPCASPTSYSGLADGEHTFSVRAVYGGLSSPDPPSVQWTVEATPPGAPTIVSAPSSPSAQTTARFKLGGLTNGDALECELDSGKWRSCAAAAEFPGLSNGDHQLQARQVNKAGLDSSVTSYTWTIDTTVPPPPVAVSAPPAETAQPSAHFEFSHEPGTTVECSLDGGRYVECTSGISPTGLSEGSHTLTARQVSAAGVASRTTTYRWRVTGTHASTATPASPATHASTETHAGTDTRAGTGTHARSKGKHRRTANKHRHAAKRKRSSRPRRHPADHARKTKGQRPAAKPKTSPPAAQHAHKNTHKDKTHTPVAVSAPKAEPPAHRAPRQRTTDEHPAKHVPQVKTAPAGTTPTPKGKTPAPATAQEPKATTSPPANTHTPKATTSPPANTHTPKATTSPPANTHTPKATTSPPANTHTPKATTSPAHPSAPSGAAPPQRIAKQAPSVRTPRTAPRPATDRAAPRPTTDRAAPAPAARRKAVSGTHTPAAPMPKSRKSAPATTPTATAKGKAPAPAARGRDGAPRRTTGPAVTDPLIWPFAPRSFAVVGRARHLVERVAAEVRHARRIICVGYTDSTGVRSYNLAIGMQRARAVCAKLRALGVHARFQAESRGEERPRATNATAAGRALNRRVELRVSY